MNFCWDEFLKDVPKYFVYQSTLSDTLKCFWNFCNDKQQYYITIYEFCLKVKNHDADYWKQFITI